MDEENDFGTSSEEQRDANPVHHDGEIVKELPKRPGRPPRKSNKSTRSAGETSPLLNMLQVEIEETMDLLILTRGIDPKIDILCRKISASLLRMEDIMHRIAKSEGFDGKLEERTNGR